MGLLKGLPLAPIRFMIFMMCLLNTLVSVIFIEVLQFAPHFHGSLKAELQSPGPHSWGGLEDRDHVQSGVLPLLELFCKLLQKRKLETNNNKLKLKKKSMNASYLWRPSIQSIWNNDFFRWSGWNTNALEDVYRCPRLRQILPVKLEARSWIYRRLQQLE